MPTSCWWPRRRVARDRRSRRPAGGRHDRLRPYRWCERRRRGGRKAGLGDVVSVDMGGTSYDVCLIRDGRPEIKMDWNWFHRYCIGMPMIDIPSVGAGGGSIAWEEGGILHVGPQSAQSQPGPGLLPARRPRADGDRCRPGARPS